MQHSVGWFIALLICNVILTHSLLTNRLFVDRRWKYALYGTDDSSAPGVPRTTIGQQTYSQYKSNAQMNQLTNLLSQPVNSLTESQVKQLQALSKYDTYDSTKFSDLHREFKREHNVVFATLGAYCSGRSGTTTDGTIADMRVIPSPLFYLEGKDGGTTSVLQSHGYHPQHLHTANMFPDTCAALKNTFPTLNVYTGRADEALRTDMLRVPFVGYYLDGCGGSPVPVIQILEAIFAEERVEWLPHKIAIGGCMRSLSRSHSFSLCLPPHHGTPWNLVPLHHPTHPPINPFQPPAPAGLTLTEADVTGRSIADREQDCTSALCRLGRERQYTVVYVGDHCGKYGLPAPPTRREAATQTCWLVLER